MWISIKVLFWIDGTDVTGESCVESLADSNSYLFSRAIANTLGLLKEEIRFS